MKGTVAFVVLALVATWAVLFLPPGKPSEPSAKSGASAHAATSAQPQEAVPQRAKPEATEPEADQASPPPAAAAAPRGDTAPGTTPSNRGDVSIIGGTASATKPAAPQEPKSATQLAEQLGDHVEYRKPTGELGEGILSPDYKLLEESYVEESRDGQWATQQELRIHNHLLVSGLGERIRLVNCQSSVCRVQLEPHGKDPYGDLLRVPGLAAILGIDASTPYSLNSAELIVYAKPEALPETPKR